MSTLQGRWRGVGFRLVLPDPWTGDASELLPVGWSESDPGAEAGTWSLEGADGGWRAAGPGGWVESYPDAGTALARVVGDVELHVAERAEGVIAVHAGVVAWEGRALLLPGRSMAGKSSLVHRLVIAGAQYCSDEYALLTSEGRVLPYPRPLSLRRPDSGVASRIPVDRLGAVPAGSLPVAVIAALQYRAGAAWDVRRVPAVQGAMSILDNTVAARSRPLEAMNHVCAAVQGTVVLQGVRAEATDAAARLLRLLQDCDPATREWASARTADAQRSAAP